MDVSKPLLLQLLDNATVDGDLLLLFMLFVGSADVDGCVNRDSNNSNFRSTLSGCSSAWSMFIRLLVAAVVDNDDMLKFPCWMEFFGRGARKPKLCVCVCKLYSFCC